MALKAKGVYCRWFSNVLHGLGGGLADPRLVQCSEAAQTDIQDGLSVSTGFVTREEEDAVMGEVTRSFRRLRYQYSHWDGVLAHDTHARTHTHHKFMLTGSVLSR